VRAKLLIVLASTACLVAAFSLAGGGGSAAAAKGGRTPAEAESRHDAVLDAHKRLIALQVPPGSRPVPSLPSKLHLSGPGVTIGSRNFFELASLWVSSEEPDQVLGWFQNHPPLGSVQNESGSFGIGKRTVSRELGFEFPELPGIAGSRYIRVTVVARGKTGSAFRADSQGVWLLPHPASEGIPAAADVLEASLLVEGKRKRTDTVTDATKIAALTALFDELVPIQPYEGGGGDFCECGGEKEKEKSVVLAFRHGRGGPVLAELSQQLPAGYRNALEVTIHGRQELALEEGWRLIESLREEGILLR
jgi:hypothetical protein